MPISVIGRMNREGQNGFTLLELMLTLSLLALLLGSVLTKLSLQSDDARLREWLQQLELWNVSVQDQAVLAGRDLSVRLQGRRLSVWSKGQDGWQLYQGVKPLPLPQALSWQVIEDYQDGFFWQVSRYGLSTDFAWLLVWGEVKCRVSGDEMGVLQWSM